MCFSSSTLQLHGYCIPRDPSTSAVAFGRLATVTEVGAPLHIVRLVQIEWIDRFRLIESIVDFVDRLRPRSLLDLRRQQFVIDDRLRPICVDFDDIVDARRCESDDDCRIGLSSKDYCSNNGLCTGMINSVFNKRKKIIYQMKMPKNTASIVYTMHSSTIY